MLFYYVQMNQPANQSAVLKFYGKKGGEKHGQTSHRGQRAVVFQHGHRVPGVPHRGLPPIRNPSSLQPHAAERLLHVSLAANGLSVLALAAGLAGETATFFLYIGGLVFPLACGYLDGCLFYLLARHTMPRRQGIAIGLYIAFTNGLLFSFCSGPFRQKKQRNRWFPKRRSQTICLFSVASGSCCPCSSAFRPPWIL